LQSIFGATFLTYGQVRARDIASRGGGNFAEIGNRLCEQILRKIVSGSTSIHLHDHKDRSPHPIGYDFVRAVNALEA